jgi:hypothetical protein
MMRTLTAAGLLDLWDAGEGLSAPERALLILSAVGLADPEEGAEHPIGPRDRALLAVQRLHYGPALSGLVYCEACGSPIEIALDLDELDRAMCGPEADGETERAMWFAFVHGALSCRYRLPQTHDHLAVLAAPTAAAAREVLLRSCITDVRRDGESRHVDDLSDVEAAAIGSAIEALDPGVIVTVELACPACRAEAFCVLDPPGFVWRRLESDARQLLYEVHALAGAYGWREADVLALPPRRRRRYLQLTSP